MKHLQVVAAVVRRGDKVLIAQRKRGDLAGFWEFPGGKLKTGEAPEQALQRELREELGVETSIGAYIATSHFVYPAFEIELMAYWVELVSEEFVLTDHHAIAWVNRDEVKGYQLAPADIPLLSSVFPEQ